MSVYESAKCYYPTLWSKERLEALVKAGKLTEKEMLEIVGETELQIGGTQGRAVDRVEI